MRKLLLFDIDGTLIDSRTNDIPESAVRGLRQAHEKGHLLFVNTGRCNSFLPDCLRRVPFDGFACGCGTHIEYHGCILFERLVEREDYVLIREAMRKTGLQGIFQGPEYCYYDHRVAPYENLRRFLRVYDRDYRAPRMDLNSENMAVNKLVTFHTDTCDYEQFVRLLGGRYQLIDNGGGFIEILPLPYTKASAIAFLMDHFGLEPDDCYVFGDSPNDIPMMTCIPNSICMGSGYDCVKELSAYVTADIDKDGLYLALQHFGLM